MKRILLASLIAILAGGAHAQLLTTGAGPNPRAGGASVALDNQCNSGWVTANGSFQASCTLTVASSATNAWMCGAVLSNFRTVNSATFGGTAMSTTAVSNLNASTPGLTMSCFSLGSPATGSQTATVTFSGTGTVNVVAMTFTGGSGAFGTAVGATGTTSPTSVTVSSATNKLVIDVLFQDTNSCGSSSRTPNSGQTELTFSNPVCTNFDGVFTASQKAGASSVTVGWTISGLTNWGEGAVSIN